MKVKFQIVTPNACAICGGTPANRTMLIDITAKKKICCCCKSLIKGINAFDCCEHNNMELQS